MVFICGLVINLTNSIFAEKRVVTSFKKNFEKQASSYLDAYSFGLQSLLESRLTVQLITLEKLVLSPVVRESILDKTYDAAEVKFTELISYDVRFDSVYIIDKNGIVKSAINREADTSPVGRDASSRDYYISTLASKEPYVGNAFLSKRGNNLVPFSIPVFDNQENLVAMVVAGSFLDSIAESVSTPADLPGMYFSIIDSQGNLIINNGEAPKEITNVKNEDLLISALVEYGDGSARSELNYLGDRVFAKGAAVEVGGNKFFVVGYYLQSTYDHDLSVIQADLNRTLATSRIRILAVFIFGSVVVFWIIKRHERDPEK